jgi:Uma2 family endonuclease
MSALSEKKTFTPSEYLAMEAEASYRSEYMDGFIYAMAGGSYTHNLLCNRVGGLLDRLLLDRDCSVLNSDMKVAIELANSFLYPDVSVVCDKPLFYQNRKDIVTNPVLIVEVLSESTQQFDLGAKFFRYRTIPSLLHYLLVYPEQPKVELFSKRDRNIWQMETFEGLETSFSLPALDLELSLAEVYHKVL